MKYLSVVQHTQSEYLGLMEDHLEGRRIRFGYARPFTAGGALPDPDVLGDGLVLLGGGPWGTAGGRDLPTLGVEITLARTCLMLEKPVIGIGVGAQILSIAGDGGSEPAPLAFQVGEARRLNDDALNGYLPARFPQALFMRDRPLPPDYAEILAEDGDGRPALFQIGRNAFGFAGHPGMKPAMAEDLIMEFEDGPEAPAAALEALRAAQTEIEDALVRIMTGLVQLTGLMRD